MIGSDVTNYIKPLYYGKNNYFNEFMREGSNAEKFKALLPSLENWLKLEF